MLEIVFGTVVVFFVGIYLYKTKKRSDKTFNTIESMWHDDILSFVKRNGLADVDIQFKMASDIKKKSSYKESIKFIASSIPKGYDFIDSTFEKGYTFGAHDHQYSSEFMYVVNGKVKIVMSDSPVEIDTFTDGEYAFMTATQFHTFEALEDSRCIFVCLPPISRGVL